MWLSNQQRQKCHYDASLGSISLTWTENDSDVTSGFTSFLVMWLWTFCSLFFQTKTVFFTSLMRWTLVSRPLLPVKDCLTIHFFVFYYFFPLHAFNLTWKWFGRTQLRSVLAHGGRTSPVSSSRWWDCFYCCPCSRTDGVHRLFARCENRNGSDFSSPLEQITSRIKSFCQSSASSIRFWDFFMTIRVNASKSLKESVC